MVNFSLMVYIILLYRGHIHSHHSFQIPFLEMSIFGQSKKFINILVMFKHFKVCVFLSGFLSSLS